MKKEILINLKEGYNIKKISAVDHEGRRIFATGEIMKKQELINKLTVLAEKAQ